MILDHYKRIVLATPNLALYGELLEKIGKDNEKGDIELLLRGIDMSGQDYNFSAIVAHAKDFKLEWEQLVLQTKISAYAPITSTTFAFKSMVCSSGRNYLKDQANNIHGLCDKLSLEREIRIQDDSDWGTFNSLNGWIRGSARNALTGYFDVRDNIGKAIGVTGKLSYQ